MNPLPARRYVRARPRIRLSGALAFRRHALAFVCIAPPPPPRWGHRARNGVHAR